MTEKEDIQKVLSELRKVLAGLSGDEEIEHAAAPQAEAPAEREIPEKSQAAGTAATATPADVTVAQIPQAEVQMKRATASVGLPAQGEVQKGTAAPAQPGAEPVQPVVPSKDVLRYAVYFTQDQAAGKDLFLKNITEFMQKTSKKLLALEKSEEEQIDVFSVNWEKVMEKAKASGTEAVFLIHPDGFDSVDLKNKFSAYKLLFESVQESKVNKKITYIDLVIELMLANK